MATLFDLLRDRAIHPVVIDRLPLAAAREVHTRIDLGGLGGKIVLLPLAREVISGRIGPSPTSHDGSRVAACRPEAEDRQHPPEILRVRRSACGDAIEHGVTAAEQTAQHVPQLEPRQTECR